MVQEAKQKISISISPDLLRYAEAYQKTHKLSTRSEAISHALKVLREKELLEGYQAMAQDYEKEADGLVEAGINDGLEPSDEDSW